jgi:hypothetical protein
MQVQFLESVGTQVRSEGRLPPTPPKIKEFHALKLWIMDIYSGGLAAFPRAYS